jgi:hypothetical protein
MNHSVLTAERSIRRAGGSAVFLAGASGPGGASKAKGPHHQANVTATWNAARRAGMLWLFAGRSSPLTKSPINNGQERSHVEEEHLEEKERVYECER